MTESTAGGPSLIKLGKMANTKEFDKLADAWHEALGHPEYSWKELVPIAGQVGRQNAVDRAEPLMISLVEWVEAKRGPAEALAAVIDAARQLPRGHKLIDHMKRTLFPYTTLFRSDRKSVV